MTTTPPLRAQVLRGGAYLAARLAAGTGINVVGVLLLTRSMGPGQYGVYAAALGFFLALQLITQLGINVYLVRNENEAAAQPQMLEVASTLTLALALAGVLVGIATVPLLAYWTHIEGIGPVALVMYATLPLANLAQIPVARLERNLDYRRIAAVELAGQIVFFIVAVPLAFARWGAWAPVCGWVCHQLLFVIFAHVTARYLPHWRWERARIRDMIHYGAGFTSSLWLYQLRKLVNPLVVGRYLGADAVGIVAVAVQIVTHLSFVTVATWRLSMSALARVQSSPERLRRAISDGMRLQTIAVGPFLIAFAWAAPFVVPLLLGRAWTEVAVVYPFIAIGMLANSTFNLQSSALYVLRRNGQMAVFHLVQIVLLAGGAMVLVPRMGLIGYGLAELVALASYAALGTYTQRAIGSPLYARTLAMSAAMALAISAGYLGLVALALTVIALQPWREVAGAIADLRGMAYE